MLSLHLRRAVASALGAAESSTRSSGGGVLADLRRKVALTSTTSTSMTSSITAFSSSPSDLSFSRAFSGESASCSYSISDRLIDHQSSGFSNVSPRRSFAADAAAAAIDDDDGEDDGDASAINSGIKELPDVPHGSR